MRKKTAILRAFPKYEYSFCFDHGKQKLMNYQYSKLYLIHLKTNTLTEIMTDVYYGLEQFCFSPDDKYIYAMGTRINSCGTVYRIDTHNNAFAEFFTSTACIQSFCLSTDGNFAYIAVTCGESAESQNRLVQIDTKTREICYEYALPLTECKAMSIFENIITIYGIIYETHIEGDGHELFDKYFIAELQINTADKTSHLVDINHAEYMRKVKATNNGTFLQALPKYIEVHYYQNDQTEFWDDTKYCTLICDGDLLERIPHHQLLDYEAKNSNFPCYALKEYEEFVLLIGYED